MKIPFFIFLNLKLKLKVLKNCILNWRM